MKIRFSPPPSVAHETNGLVVRYAPSKRPVANWRWRILVVLVISPLLIFLARVLYSAIWTDMPGFIIMDQTVLKAPLAGRLAKAPAVGTYVREGDTIVELQNDVLSNERKVLISQRERAAQYVQPDVPVPAQLPVLRSLARERRAHYDSLRGLMAEGAATQAEVSGAYADLAATLAQLKALEQEYALENVRPPAARLPPPSARLSEVEAKLQSLKLTAPESGVVAQVFGTHGEWINENTEVIDIRLDRPARIEAYVEPSWAKYTRVGHWATVKFLDGYTIRARVKEVKMSAQRLPADRANPLTVRHHSIIAMLEPDRPLPEAYRIHVLPVNVQFDLEWTGLKLIAQALNPIRTADRVPRQVAALSRGSP
jgi:HlyD family secretion protein